jgi:DNA-binding Lrp family transcriptional regulator
MTLKERLERYLRNNHDWIASGDLQRIVAEKTSYSPQNVGRRLRELAEEGKLEVMYVRNHAHYRSAVKQLSLPDTEQYA